MTSSEPEAGQLLGALLGSYRVAEPLGAGGMGEVYIGRHDKLGHRVAIKVLRLELSRNADMVRRFFNEAQAATAIRSPGIVQIFDFGSTADGRAYFVMELLEGQSLEARLKQRRLDHAECCRVIRQVTNVLQAAHTAGITHRDLKPDNLFLVPDVEVVGGERVKVLDFGIAKLAGEVHAAAVKTRTDVVMGTPTYMSPEQSRGAGAVDARSDIYSLGCILFELVCGRPPFVGEGAGGIIGAHQYVEPPAPRSLAPKVPPRLEKLILHMLAKAPTARPQTMAAVGQALEEILRALEKAPRRAAARPAATRPVTRAPAATPAQTDATLVVPQASGAPAGPGRRAWIVLGGVVAGVVGIGIVLGSRGSGPEPAGGAGSDAAAAGAVAVAEPADAGNAAAPVAAAAAAAEPIEMDPAEPASEPPADADGRTDAAAAPSPAAIDAPEAPRTATPGELKLECLRYQADEQWAELSACADRLGAVDPATAKELQRRAELETKAAPRIAAFEAAMRDQDLKKAAAELSALKSVSRFGKLLQTYQQSENAAIRDLASRLESVNRGDCKPYNALVQQERASKPPRVVAEASRQVACTPAQSAQAELLRPRPVAAAPAPKPAACNAKELAEKGAAQYSQSLLGPAFSSYEAAWSCKPDPDYALKGFIVACNLSDAAKAKLFWQRLPSAFQQRAVMICVRNGITEEQLNAP